MHWFWVSFFLLSSFVCEQVAGVKCYVCQSETDPACGDIFTLSEKSKDFVGNCRTSCFKFTANRGDNRDISRGCLPSIRIMPHCERDTIGDLHGTFCACNEDFCNGATTVQLRHVTYIMTLLVLFILWKVVY